MKTEAEKKRGVLGIFKRKHARQRELVAGSVEIASEGEKQEELVPAPASDAVVTPEVEHGAPEANAPEALAPGMRPATSGPDDARKGRSFFRRERNSIPAVERKAPKREKREKKPSSDEAIALPINIAIDFYRGVRVRDAEQIARAFVEHNFAAPNASYVYVQKWRDGCAVEMQEGGGKAYLPEVLAQLDSDPDAIVALPMSGRVMQVRLNAETSSIEALILPEQQSPGADAFVALPSATMTPLDRRGAHIFVIGSGLLAASLIALVFSISGFFTDTAAWSRPFLQQTRVQDLPSAQIPKIEAALQSADCVAKLEFANGSWAVHPGWDDGSGMCSSTRPRGQSGEALAEGQPATAVGSFSDVAEDLDGEHAGIAGASAVGSSNT